MRSEAVAFGIAGIVFGLIAGWVIGSQQAPARMLAETQASAAAPPAGAGVTRAAALDDTQVNALRTVADGDPSNAQARVQLANIYFDAERYDDAIKWYEQAVRLTPNDVNVSTDLGVCYYYTNQPDKALAQFDHSLKLDPKHIKTLLNVGIVKAFGKQDLDGAALVWEQVVQLAPDSPEAAAAKRALDSLRATHPAPAAR